MDKINIHITKDKYRAILHELLFLYINEDNNVKAEAIFKIFNALNNCDFDQEAK